MPFGDAGGIEGENGSERAEISATGDTCNQKPLSQAALRLRRATANPAKPSATAP
jgi:hypothetical protein